MTQHQTQKETPEELEKETEEYNLHIVDVYSGMEKFATDKSVNVGEFFCGRLGAVESLPVLGDETKCLLRSGVYKCMCFRRCGCRGGKCKRETDFCH